jgi:hypothetical protein
MSYSSAQRNPLQAGRLRGNYPNLRQSGYSRSVAAYPHVSTCPICAVRPLYRAQDEPRIRAIGCATLRCATPLTLCRAVGIAALYRRNESTFRRLRCTSWPAIWRRRQLQRGPKRLRPPAKPKQSGPPPSSASGRSSAQRRRRPRRRRLQEWPRRVGRRRRTRAQSAWRRRGASLAAARSASTWSAPRSDHPGRGRRLRWQPWQPRRSVVGG